MRPNYNIYFLFMKNKIVSQFSVVKYREFPHVLFGESSDGTIYFDATACIEKEKTEKTCSIHAFSEKFGWWITIFSEAYSVPREKMVVQNGDEGNWLMEESLILLFLSYLDAAFAVYMLERITEMLLTGIVLSDNTLLSMAKDRLTKDDLS